MENKKVLVGVGLIGATLLILPKISGSEIETFQTSGGGGGGVPSVAQVGLPAGAGAVEGSTKKEASVTYIIESPDFPTDTATELPTKKETTTTTTTPTTSGGGSPNVVVVEAKSGEDILDTGIRVAKETAGQDSIFITKKEAETFSQPRSSPVTSVIKSVFGWTSRFSLGLW